MSTPLSLLPTHQWPFGSSWSADMTGGGVSSSITGCSYSPADLPPPVPPLLPCTHKVSAHDYQQNCPRAFPWSVDTLQPESVLPLAPCDAKSLLQLVRPCKVDILKSLHAHYSFMQFGSWQCSWVGSQWGITPMLLHSRFPLLCWGIGAEGVRFWGTAWASAGVKPPSFSLTGNNSMNENVFSHRIHKNRDLATPFSWSPQQVSLLFHLTSFWNVCTVSVTCVYPVHACA